MDFFGRFPLYLFKEEEVVHGGRGHTKMRADRSQKEYSNSNKIDRRRKDETRESIDTKLFDRLHIAEQEMSGQNYENYKLNSYNKYSSYNDEIYDKYNIDSYDENYEKYHVGSYNEKNYDNTYNIGSYDDDKYEKLDEPSEDLTEISLEEVALHDCYEDCWIILYDKVYNITKFMQSHPGGDDVMLDYAGRDGTIAFRSVGHSKAALEMLEEYLIGILPMSQRMFDGSSECQWSII